MTQEESSVCAALKILIGNLERKLDIQRIMPKKFSENYT